MAVAQESNGSDVDDAWRRRVGRPSSIRHSATASTMEIWVALDSLGQPHDARGRYRAPCGGAIPAVESDGHPTRTRVGTPYQNTSLWGVDSGGNVRDDSGGARRGSGGRWVPSSGHPDTCRVSAGSAGSGGSGIVCLAGVLER